MLAAAVLTTAFLAPGRVPLSSARRAGVVVAEEAAVEVAWTAKGTDGLKIFDETVGGGAEAQDGSLVLVDFKACLAGSTEEVATYKGLEFELGEKKMIPGWEEGIRGMKVGGKRKMLIPPSLAYGDEGGGPKIPPGSTLEYETTLVDATKLEGIDFIASKVPGGKTNLILGGLVVLVGIGAYTGIIQ